MTLKSLGRSLVWLFVTSSSSIALGQREQVLESINRRESVSWESALKIWGWAEPGYMESKSSDLLAGMLQDAGFTVTRNIAGIPTAFVASVGEGRPILGMSESSAATGLSNQRALILSNSAYYRKFRSNPARRFGHDRSIFCARD